LADNAMQDKVTRSCLYGLSYIENASKRKNVASQEGLCLFNDLAIYVPLSPPLGISDLSRFWPHWL